MAGASYSDAMEDASTELLCYFHLMLQHLHWQRWLFGLILIGSLTTSHAMAAGDADPFGDYDHIEMLTVGLGPIFYLGDIGDAYEQGAGFNMRIIVRLAAPFSLVTAIGGALAEGSDNTVTSDKLYYDLGARLRLRLAGDKALWVPYVEAGGGISGLDGTTLTGIAGGGFDAQIWEDGALGIQAFYDYYVGENGAAVPVFLSFSYIL